MFHRKIKYESGDWMSFFIFFLFILSRFWSYSIIKSGSMPAGRMDLLVRRLRLFLFNDIFSVSFCVLIPDFKVRHMVLTVIVHVLYVKERNPNILEEVFL
jgi:hypothetical protein